MLLKSHEDFLAPLGHRLVGQSFTYKARNITRVLPKARLFVTHKQRKKNTKERLVPIESLKNLVDIGEPITFLSYFTIEPHSW